MKVLLDECVDWRLLRELSEHETKTVRQAGWEQMKNGALLRLAAGAFDVFLSVDKNLPGQQNVSELHLAVIVLRGKTTRLSDLLDLLPLLRAELQNPHFGKFVVLSWRDIERNG